MNHKSVTSVLLIDTNPKGFPSAHRLKDLESTAFLRGIARAQDILRQNINRRKTLNLQGFPPFLLLICYEFNIFPQFLDGFMRVYALSGVSGFVPHEAVNADPICSGRVEAGAECMSTLMRDMLHAGAPHDAPPYRVVFRRVHSATIVLEKVSALRCCSPSFYNA